MHLPFWCILIEEPNVNYLLQKNILTLDSNDQPQDIGAGPGDFLHYEKLKDIIHCQYLHFYFISSNSQYDIYRACLMYHTHLFIHRTNLSVDTSRWFDDFENESCISNVQYSACNVDVLLLLRVRGPSHFPATDGHF